MTEECAARTIWRKGTDRLAIHYRILTHPEMAMGIDDYHEQITINNE
jgi:hypothetical protein